MPRLPEEEQGATGRPAPSEAAPGGRGGIGAGSSAVALGLLSGALLGVPRFLLPYGVAVLILAGLLGAAPGALCWLCLLPIVRRLTEQG